MRRFFIEKIAPKDGVLTLKGQEARHISTVLRMGPGDRLVLMDRKGRRYRSIIHSIGSRKVVLFLERPLSGPCPSPVRIVLCQALLKSRAMDYLIQKTSELGVDLIVPYSSERTVVRIRAERLPNKMRRWQEIAQNAARQSDRGTPAELFRPNTFNALLRKWQGRDVLRVIMWEEEGAEDLKGLLRSSSPARSFIGMVGPEGGFGRQEVKNARDAGFISVSLGKRVLRSETAAITLVALVQYEWGDLSLGQLK